MIQQKPEGVAREMTPREKLQKARSLLKAALGGAYEAIESEAATAGTVAMALAALSQAHQAWNDAIVAIPIDAMVGFSDKAMDVGRPAGLDARDWAHAFLSSNENRVLDYDEVATWFAGALRAGAHSMVAEQ